MSGGFIRLAPDPADVALGLSRDEATTEARAAYRRAGLAQGRLVADLALTRRLFETDTVNYTVLSGMRRQAEEQVERAQAVVLALVEAMEAIERYRGDRS